MRILFSLFICHLTVLAADWPQWRGPSSSGIATGAAIPTEWSETKNLAWKTELPGRGTSQPVIWGKHVFLTSEMDSGDAPAGHIAPIHHMSGTVFLHPDSTGANKLHRLIVLALDRETGKVLWQKTAYEGTAFDNKQIGRAHV